MRYILMVIITALSHIMVAMDPIATETTLSTSRSIPIHLIETIDTEINKQFKSNTQKAAQSIRISSLSEKKMFKILAIVQQYNPTITTSFIKALKKKNDFFMKTITYFCELANKNLNCVTNNTLDIINNPLCQQPIAQLNKLILPFKQYAMAVAYKDIQFLHNVVFEGHTNSIQSIDISKTAHLVASASEDESFRLWDFDNGKQLHVFEEKADCGYVRFNTDGSQLATATTCEHNPEKSRIMIWNTQSKKRLYKIETIGPITWIDFIPGKNETTLIVAKPFSVSYYTLKKNSKPVFLRTRNNGITTEKITSLNNSMDKNHNWYITKNSRPLALCNQALNNINKEEDLATIELTVIYKNLSEHEKEIFKAKLNQKLQEYKR